MLELAADLGLLDESAGHLGIVVVFFEQDLDGQVSPQVGVAALEDGPHAAVADLAQDLVAAGLFRHLGGRGADDGSMGIVLGVAKQDSRDRTGRLGQSGQDAANQGPVQSRLVKSVWSCSDARETRLLTVT